MEKELEIYIHIPFCVRKCLYCDFFSGPFGAPEREQYFYDLREEIREAVKYRPEDYAVRSIFFGGGTPSLAAPEALLSVMEEVRGHFRIARDAEISLEANPGTLTPEKLRAYREMGVNRLSLGLQSADDELLKRLGRIHTYEDFLESYEAARSAGFRNINVDLMSGLPGETLENHRNTLKKVLSLSPEHLSCYSLIIAENTPFFALYGDPVCEAEDGGGNYSGACGIGRFSAEDASGACENIGEEAPAASGNMEKIPPIERVLLPDEETDRRMVEETNRLLREAGYLRYEISNYARPGFACRHNIGYWTGVPYLGFGASAASYMPVSTEKGGEVLMRRFKNAESLDYRKRPQAECEELRREDLMAEFMILGLRMTQGVTDREFRGRFSLGLSDIYGEIIRKYTALGALQWDGEHLSFTDFGMDVSNRILQEFL